MTMLPTASPPPKPPSPPLLPLPRFPAAEEAALVAAATKERLKANALFGAGNIAAAITLYTSAVSTVPIYLSYELAVLHSNLAACHLKAQEWKETVKDADVALKELDKVMLVEDVPKLEEIIFHDDKDEAEVPEGETAVTAAEEKKYPKDDVARLRSKILMRRARARLELGAWTDLTGAQEDYESVRTWSGLPSAERQIVEKELRALPAKVELAKTKETADMMGKLKDLGNGLLKPFGLSTENFNFVKDENTGGYSMNFNQ